MKNRFLILMSIVSITTFSVGTIFTQRASVFNSLSLAKIEALTFLEEDPTVDLGDLDPIAIVCNSPDQGKCWDGDYVMVIGIFGLPEYVWKNCSFTGTQTDWCYEDHPA